MPRVDGGHPIEVAAVASAAAARPSDVEILGELAGQALHEAAGRRGGPLLLTASPLTRSPGALAGYLATSGHLLLAGRFAGAVVGVAAARRVTGEGGPIAVVDLLYVEPAARRVGVGDALMEDVVEWATASGCAGIDVTVLPGDQPSKAFFEGWGLTARSLVLHRALAQSSLEPAARGAPIPCAGSVVIDAGRLLLVRRANAPDAGRWSLPGGRLEPGELPPEAAARETMEETGCEVVVGDLAGSALIAGSEVDYVVDDYFATLVRRGSEPVAGGDASEAAFVPLGEVTDLDLVTGLADWLRRHGVLPES